MAAPFKGWDYEDFPSDAERETRCIQLVTDLGAGRLDPIQSCMDTRPVHHTMFHGMTLSGQEYFVGNYRGEPHPYLETYVVTFGGMYGAPPSAVAAHIDSLAQYIQSMPIRQPAITANQSPREQLFRTVGVVCAVMVRFFTIHPYANGNGHIGRYMTWALLFRFGYAPKLWEINRKFGDEDEYYRTIGLFRSGDQLPLIKFVLSSI